MLFIILFMFVFVPIWIYSGFKEGREQERIFAARNAERERMHRDVETYAPNLHLADTRQEMDAYLAKIDQRERDFAASLLQQDDSLPYWMMDNPNRWEP